MTDKPIEKEGEAPVAAAAYDPTTEVAIHVMPGRYKIMHTENQAAKKTGGLILAAGGLLLLAAIGGFIWLVLSDQQPRQASVSMIVTASTTEQPVATSSIDVTTSLPAPEPVGQATSSLDAATSSVALATTATSSTDSTNQLPIVAAIDTDLDGLTDPEEDVLGSDKAKKNSDDDAYDDLNELSNGYNPSGPGKLSDNPLVAKYSNAIFSADYPRSWSFKNADDSSVIFTAPDTQFFQVSISENANQQTLDDWYSEQFQLSSVPSDRYLMQYDKDGSVALRTIRSVDGNTYYLQDRNGKKIIALNYGLGSVNANNFPNLFLALVKSFRLK